MAPALLSFIDLGRWADLENVPFVLAGINAAPEECNDRATCHFILGGLKSRVRQCHPHGSPLTENLNVPSIS